MKELLLNLKRNSQPKYQQLAEALRRAILTGKVAPGETLPSSRDIALRYQMNRHTVMRAFAELIAEGWIVSQQKQSYQVTPQLPSEFLRARPNIEKKALWTKKTLTLARTVPIAEFRSGPASKYSFPSGAPDIRQFPMTEFKSYLYDALKNKNNLAYGHPAGHGKLQEQIKTYLRRIRNVKDREIVVTHGSQEAIFFLAQLLIQPGDVVAVEALGYPPAIEALRFAGAKLLPVRLDAEGLIVEDLRRYVKKHKIRLLYTTPLHQYPTTVTLSTKRRLELYQLCYENDILILEDDYDHEFHYSSQPIAPLAANDPAGIVLYVSTFSKILFPSARLGFMAVPAEFASEVAKLKRISSRQNEQLLQDGIARWMASGGFEKHLRKMRRLYDHRLSTMLEDLERWQKKYPAISWKVPDGGMALWLNLEQDTLALSKAVQQNHIYVNCESDYGLNPQSGTHLRLGFSGQTSQENRASLNALFEFLLKFNS